MLRAGTRVELETPVGWVESRQGTRWVYRGPAGQELMLSASLVEGTGSDTERQKAEETLLARTLLLAREAASREGLVNVTPLRRDDAVAELPCWSFASESREKNVGFLGAVVWTMGGVLLATLEGPLGDELLATFRQFLGSIRRPTR